MTTAIAFIKTFTEMPDTPTELHALTDLHTPHIAETRSIFPQGLTARTMTGPLARTLAH